MFEINNHELIINRYPDETPYFHIDLKNEDAMIKWYYEKDEEFLLYLITKHLKSNQNSVSLYIPYIPHARMDRVKTDKEVFTLKYFCEFINNLYFKKVIVCDAHSSVSLELLNNVCLAEVEKNINKLINSLLDSSKDVIFFPDEGSYKRYSKSLDFPYLYGLKKRDWETGKITGLDIFGEIPKEKFNVLIIDDISSYGGTFLHSAKKLKEIGANDIYLYITHCENSILKGELINSGLLKKIFTTKSIFTKSHELIEVMEE